MKQSIYTEKAPPCIGPYSQAIKSGSMIFLSGQIPIDKITQNIVSDDIKLQTEKVFENLKAVTQAAGGNLDSIVRLSVYLTDLTHFPVVNEIMQKYFKQPYPARTTLGVSALPKGAKVEVDAIMVV